MVSSRPLNNLERFFCDEPARPRGEAKLISAVGDVSMPQQHCNHSTVQRAWLRTSWLFPYLRCRVDYDGDDKNVPLLVQRTHAEFAEYLRAEAGTANDPVEVDILAPRDASPAELRDRLKKQSFDEGNVLATVGLSSCLRPPSSQPTDGADMDAAGVDDVSVVLSVTLSHIGADARGLFAVTRVFLEQLSHAIDCSDDSIFFTSTPEGVVHDLLGLIPVQKIVSNPLKPPVLPDGMPALVPPAPAEIDRNTLSDRVVLGNAHLVLSASETNALLGFCKAHGLSVQSVFSAAGAIAVLKRSSSDVVRAFVDSGESVTVGCQVTVQMRDLIEPNLPPCSLVLGGSVFWVYVAIRRDTTLLQLAQELTKEIRLALGDGRVFGYFKMYLGPPPSAPAPTTPAGSDAGSNKSAVAHVNAQQAKHLVTFNFTNIGKTELSDMRALGNIRRIHNFVMEMRLCNRCEPLFAYLRSHAHMLHGKLHVATTFTKPCFSDEYVRAFINDLLTTVRLFVNSSSQGAHSVETREAETTIAAVLALGCA